MSEFLKGFEDPAAVQRYAENPPRYMPGYADMQRMAAVLLRTMVRYWCSAPAAVWR